MTTLHLVILSTVLRFVVTNFTNAVDSYHIFRLKNGLKSLTRLSFLVPSNCDYSFWPHDSFQLNYALELHNCENQLDTVENLSEFSMYESPGKIIHRVKRSDALKLGEEEMRWPHNIKDPYFSSQWHVLNAFNIGNDVEVFELWDAGFSGENTHVGIIDDGIEWTNPDISKNFCWKCSFDLNDGDTNPTPRLDTANSNHHGTRCAGLISAVPNDVCGVGVAPQAQIGGIRLLDGPITDALEAQAYHIGFHLNDIYSCSWGPTDDGMTIDGPHELTQEAIMYAASIGRNGRGALIVMASGNGATKGDSCAFDGYAASVYTFTIGAISSSNDVPEYSEGCSALLGLAYSGGSSHSLQYDPPITTTDWLLGGEGCTSSFSGTSASAPLAAGIFAIVLETRPCLIGRDVLWLTALSSRKLPDMEQEPMWSRNGAGLTHTNQHGFGILSATRLAKAALAWPGLPWMTILSTPSLLPKTSHFNSSQSLILSYHVTKEEVDKFYLYTVEQIVLSISLYAAYRGAVYIVVYSPMGGSSMVMPPRLTDRYEHDLDFAFTSLHFLGEDPIGEWIVNVSLLPNTDSDHRSDQSKLSENEVKSWRLTFHGSSLPNDEVANRIALVEKAMTRDLSELIEEAVNITCSQKLVDFGHNEDILPDYVLKSILLAQFFFGSLGIWIVVEDLIMPYLFVSDESTPLLPHLDTDAASINPPGPDDPRGMDSMSGKVTDLWRKFKASFQRKSPQNQNISPNLQTTSMG